MLRVSVVSLLSMLLVSSFAQQTTSDPCKGDTETKDGRTVTSEFKDKLTFTNEADLRSHQTENFFSFYVITRENSDEGKRLIVGDTNSLRESGFNSAHPTRILVHGWMGSRNSLVNRRVSEAYLNRGEYNIITVDWSAISGNLDYTLVRNSINKVAPKLTDLVDFLSSHGHTHPSNLYLIGHSLGAHLVGAAARRVRSGRVGVIIALDAALPLFVNRIKDRVSKSDASHVVSIHTNGGSMGVFQPIGHAAFYPNWGKRQPGCGFDMFGECSHNRSVEYFAESLVDTTSSFVAQNCNGFFGIIKNECQGSSDPVYMGGDPINTTNRGVFYLKTRSNQPYSVRWI